MKTTGHAEKKVFGSVPCTVEGFGADPAAGLNKYCKCNTSSIGCQMMAMTDQEGGVNLVEGGVNATTDTECSAACTANPSCKSWINVQSSTQCYLLSNVPSTLKEAADRTYGLRCTEGP